MATTLWYWIQFQTPNDKSAVYGAQLVECLPRMQEALGPMTSVASADLGIQAHDPSTYWLEAESSGQAVEMVHPVQTLSFLL